MATKAAEIARVARSKAGSQDWMYDKVKDNFAANTNKCNKFVYDAIIEAGVKAPTVSMYVVFSRPPTAGEWADPKVEISGWSVVDDPQPGDVVAEAHRYADATGHVGIVVGSRETASANANVGGTITVNDWGFRPDQHCTFRRYA